MRQVQMGNALKNDEWIDADDIELKSLPELPGFHVLIKPVSVKSKTKGGIFIPDSTKDDISYLTTVGEVIGLGELAYKDENKFPNGNWCNVGDYVCYGKHAGTKLFYQNIRMILLFDDQIIMKVDDTTDLDPSFHLT